MTESERDQVICFGIYTTQNKVMKMSAQLFPLYPNETREVRLELKKNGKREEATKAKVREYKFSNYVLCVQEFYIKFTVNRCWNSINTS